MRTRPFYAVVSGRSVKRVTQSWPTTRPGEIVIRLALEIPDHLIEQPAHVLEVPADAVSVGVEAEEPELPDEEA